jgi:DNA-binding transcriptional MocR family regulator
MTRAARLSLVGLARKYDALVITDDVYDFLQWPATSSPSPSALEDLKTALLPRIVDLDLVVRRENRDEDDGFGNAVSNGSFSKIVGPGVRTGWAEASPKFIYGLSQCGSSRSGGAPSQLTATVINELLASGELVSTFLFSHF